MKVALIGGTSHVGKSTTAAALAERLGWPCVSTDKLGRHPGRPWSTAAFALPEHVVQHYLDHDPQALTEAQLAHYRNMWPTILALVERHAGDEAAGPLVLEGSGVWPDNVGALELPGVRGVWITAAPDLIEARIRRNSAYAAASERDRRLIDGFIARSQLYDVAMMASVRRLGLPFIVVGSGTTADQLADECLARLAPFA